MHLLCKSGHTYMFFFKSMPLNSKTWTCLPIPKYEVHTNTSAAGRVEYRSGRDTWNENMHFWSTNHVPGAMNKARSYLEEKRSWLSLEGQAVNHQVRRWGGRVARRERYAKTWARQAHIHTWHVTGRQLFIERSKWVNGLPCSWSPFPSEYSEV